MRVYERIKYNLKQIKFKDNQDFLDVLLEKYGYKYKNIAFDFALGSDNCYQRINKNFPTLIKYKMTLPTDPDIADSYQETYFSSIRDLKNGEDIFIDNEDIPQFCELLKKIPNPINFGSMEVVLDGIDWYGDSSGQKVGKSDHSFGAFAMYYNNNIRYIKHWDSGNKHNIIQFVIDRTLSDEEIRPYPEAFEKMLAELRKPLSKGIECVFEEEEKRAWEEAKKPLQERILKENFSDIYVPHKNNTPPQNISNFLTADAKIPSVSFKKGFNKAAKRYGFKYILYNNSCYVYSKTNDNGHSLKVEFINESWSKNFEVHLLFTGCNFHRYFKNLPIASLISEDHAEAYADNMFRAALKFEEKYSDEMLETYGKTPKWYK